MSGYLLLIAAWFACGYAARRLFISIWLTDFKIDLEQRDLWFFTALAVVGGPCSLGAALAIRFIEKADGHTVVRKARK